MSIVAHSLARQMLIAVDYIHSLAVAHRDINPSNWVVSQQGRVILIDFGQAVKLGDEVPGHMTLEVGTGSVLDRTLCRVYTADTSQIALRPYRAPELLFGSRAYDPLALDLWSLGVTLAEFFTPLSDAIRAASISSDDASVVSLISASQNGPVEREGQAIQEMEQSMDRLEIEQGVESVVRTGLFKSEYGDFALIGSIFRLIGTPTVETWPVRFCGTLTALIY